MDESLLRTLWGNQAVPKKKPKPKRVMVFNFKTHQFSTYSSASYFYNKYNLSSRIVLPNLKKGVGRSGHWFYTYYDENNPVEGQNRLQEAVNKYHWEQQGK